MNILFKIKHYLLLYFNRDIFYSVGKNNVLNTDYWINGYQKNIKTSKWTIENGIPLGLYTKDLDAPVERRVHVSGLCEYCFALKELDRFHDAGRVVDFIVDHLHIDTLPLTSSSYSYWKTYVKGTSKDYYVHGMGQGQLLSLLTRYNLIKNDKTISDLLVGISNSYLVDFDHDNGFVILNDEEVFLEEYPKNQSTESHVLNGWIYSILGLHDYLQYAKLKGIEDENFSKKTKIYKDTVKTLEDKIGEYNLRFWSLYNSPKSLKNICSIHYQEQHIVLLKALYVVTNREVFKKYSNLFKKQYNNFLFRTCSLFCKIIFSNFLKHGRIYKKT